MRPLGNSSDPILYAANLALAFGASLVLFFIGKDIFKTQKERLLLCLSASVILMGILVSGSRGVWVALFPACVITLYFYNRRSALLLLSVFIVLAAITFTFSNTMKERASTIVTSLYTENETGSTGNRVELWKGALLMFKQSPFTGIGSGDFEVTIKKYIAEKKIRNIEAKGHAHSIYFQIVATRGLIGISIFIAFLVSLLLWGSREIKNGNQIGGYTIVMSTLLALLGGLTENHIEVHRYLAAFGFTIGLIGPYQRAG
ncbi:MAG: O-antigen ligase family protein [Nitrospirota bacterium]